ncbi:MAG TPA: HEAT repeat domain-containing protein [Thermoguttaceae bacterium]|nr:HEAT repeat domain-containing protein [Thermoguttaceae bacterium]
MSESFQCPKCAARYALKEHLAGKGVKCRKCGTAFRVPAPKSAYVEAEAKPPMPNLFDEEFGKVDATPTPATTIPTPTTSNTPPRLPGSSPAAFSPQPLGPATGPVTGLPHQFGGAKHEPARLSGVRLSDKDRQTLRAGAVSAAFGLSAMVLPFVGLQFKAIATFGEFVPYVAAIFAVLGAGLVFYALRSNLAVGAFSAGGILVLLAVLVGVSILVGSGDDDTDGSGTSREVAEGRTTGPDSSSPLGSSADSVWSEFRSPTERFRVEFPGTPMTVRDPRNMDLKSYAVKTHQATYCVMCAVVGGTNAPPQVVLENAQNGAVNGVKGWLIESKEVTLPGGQPGRAFVVGCPSGSVIECRAYLTGGRLYQTLVETTPDRQGAAETLKFHDSFQILASASPDSPAVGDSASADDSDLIDAALSDLRSTNGGRKSNTLSRLARIQVDPERQEEVAEVLVDLLSFTDDFTRSDVLEALAVWHTDEAVPAMIRQLDDKSLLVRQKALEVLSTIEDQRVIEAIAKRLPETFDRMLAVRALIAMGPAAEETVLKYVEHPDRQVSSAACEILAEIGTQKSIAVLTKLARSEDFFVQVEAQRASKAIIDAGRGTPEPQPEPQPAPAGSPGVAVDDPPAAADEMAQALDDLTSGTLLSRKEAAAKLIAMGSAAEEGVLKALRHPDPFVCAEACKILGKIGTKKSVRQLTLYARHPNLLVRSAAERALREIDSRDE